MRTLEETVRGRAALEAIGEEIEILFASAWDGPRIAATREMIAGPNILIERLFRAQLIQLR